MNHSLKSFLFLSLAFLVAIGQAARAAEPNEFFAESTLLAPGVLSVSDDLTPGGSVSADTLLVARAGGIFDDIIFETFDDDGSPLGDGTASAFTDVDVINPGEIRFSITGFGDDFFEGNHIEEGDYEAYVEVFNSFGNSIDNFSIFGTLFSGAVDEHNFVDTNWLGGTYAVTIDNEPFGVTGGDVDFFTFTGLNPGESFTAETSSSGSIDTLLGLFDDAGTLVDQDDDSGLGFWSRLQGTVPASGNLTFAVTGHEDGNFDGGHSEEDVYDLQLSTSGTFSADFNNDNQVNGLDLTDSATGWQARYGINLDGTDFLAWQQQFGSGTTTAVPEPTTLALLLLATLFPNRRVPLARVPPTFV